MTKDEIIRFAIKCKLVNTNNRDGIYMDALIDFAKLVEDKVRQEIAEKNAPVIKKVNEHIKELQDAVKAEREACAKIEEKLACSPAMFPTMGEYRTYRDAVLSYQKAIRARGQA
jgi:hypothetical protein